MKVRAETFLTSVVVYINDVTHLMFRRAEFLGLQSWPDENCYSLQITFKSGPTIRADYETRETWTAVLAALAKLDITAV